MYNLSTIICASILKCQDIHIAVSSFTKLILCELGPVVFTMDYIHIITDKDESKKSLWRKFKKSLSLLCRPAIRTPLFLIMMGHFGCHSSTLTGMRSYLIEILDSMQIPIQPQWFTVSIYSGARIYWTIFEV